MNQNSIQIKIKLIESNSRFKNTRRMPDDGQDKNVPTQSSDERVEVINTNRDTISD